MKQASLKIKNYTSNIGIVDNNDIQRKVFRLICISFGALGLLYLLILSNMVWNIIERRSFIAETRSLSTEVSNLELDYLALSNTIDLSLSSSMGFNEVKPNFAVRDKSIGFVKNNKSFSNIRFVKNEI